MHLFQRILVCCVSGTSCHVIERSHDKLRGDPWVLHLALFQNNVFDSFLLCHLQNDEERKDRIIEK